MLTHKQVTRFVFVFLSALLNGILFAGSQPAAAHSRTKNILSLSDKPALDGQTGYRNSLLGYEIQYPGDWKLQESLSLGYPYISIIDPLAQVHSTDAGELHQGALIEISAEEYLAQVPVGEYIMSFIPLDVSRLYMKSSLEREEIISDVWGFEGVGVTFSDDDLFYSNHATLVDYAESQLLLQIRLTVFQASLDQKQTYLDSFNEMLASLHFSPPPTMPQPSTWISESPSESVQLGLAGTSATQFLTLPFESQADMGVAQGWYYSSGGIHAGVDYIKGSISSPYSWDTFDVLAAADGVACANCVYGPGNKVWIQHTVGNTVYYTYYGHLASIEPGILASNWTVTRGQKIGTAGYTGTRYIHLHFGVYKTSTYEVDPYDLYTTQYAYYPNLTYSSMGAGHLFTDDPPAYPWEEPPDQPPPDLPITSFLPVILQVEEIWGR